MGNFIYFQREGAIMLMYEVTALFLLLNCRAPALTLKLCVLCVSFDSRSGEVN